MKNLFTIILIASSLIGCHSAKNTQTIKPKIPNEETFLAVERNACLIKHGYKNKKYCNCFSNVKSQIIPSTLKNRALRGDSSVISETLSLMIANKTKIDACNSDFVIAKAEKININIPEFEVPELAKDVLSKFKGALLTPDNRKLIKPILPIGYEFYMNVVGNKPQPRYNKRLTRIEGNTYYFTDLTKRNKRTNNRKFEYGVDYYLPLNDLSVMEYRLSTNSKCIFVLDTPCEYSGYSRRKRYKMYTIYKDGLWISVEPSMFSRSNKLVIRIFGLDGFPLYKYNKNLKTGSSIERVRFEPGESWLNYIGK